MNNSLVKTNGVWNKIKRFFNKIFGGKRDKVIQEISTRENVVTKTVENTNEKIEMQNETKKSFKEEISYNEEIKEKNRKEKTANELLNGKIDVYDLSDEEVDEMTGYFTEDIERQNKELQRIRNHIIQMKKQLQE